jgi:hypothetical protein
MRYSFALEALGALEVLGALELELDWPHAVTIRPAAKIAAVARFIGTSPFTSSGVQSPLSHHQLDDTFLPDVRCRSS